MKIGDKVKFVSEVGGGKVAGFQGNNIVLVEDEDGFQIPTPINDVVVVNDEDYSTSKIVADKVQKKGIQIPDDDFDYDPADRPVTFKAPAEERRGGDKLNAYIAFVPMDVKTITSSRFETYIVNDSNYYMHYIYMTAEGNGYTPVTTTTIGKDGTITTPNVEFNKDGSGHVAGGNIAWDKDGNASFIGEIQASGGSFMSEDKENMRKTTIDSQNGDFRMFAPNRIDESTGKPNQNASQNLIFEIRTYVDYDTNTTFPEIKLIHAATEGIYVKINPLDGIHITNSDARIILGDTNGEHMTISPGGITVWNGNTELKSW